MSLERIRTSSSTTTTTSPAWSRAGSPSSIRAQGRGGRPRRARPRHRLHADRRLPRADPPAPGGGARLRERRHVQPRRVLPDGAGQHPLLPPLHVGEPLRPRRHRAGERAHPARRRPARRGRGGSAGATRRRSARAGGIDFQILGIGKTGHIGFNEPGSGAESRTRLVTLDTVTRRDAAADFFGEENVPREAITMGVATILDAREIAHPRDRRAQGRDRAPRGRGRDRPRGRRDLPAAPPEHHVLPRPRRRRRAHARSRRRGCSARCEWTPELDGRARWSGSRSRRGKAILKLTQRDYAEHQLSSLVARLRLAGRAERRGVQRARRQDPRHARKLPRGPAGHLLLAASGRRRDLDGRHPAQAGRERERDHRRLHDERQHRRVRPRRAALSSTSCGGWRPSGIWTRERGRARCATRVDEFLDAQAAGRGGHPRGAGHQAHHPRGRGGRRHRDARARRRSARASSTCRSTRPGKVRKDPIGPADVAIVRDAARGAAARPDLRRRRPLRPARHAPHVQGGDRARAGRVRGGGDAARGVALPRRLAGVAGDRGRPGWCRCRRRSCGSRSRRSSSTRRRRTRRPFPGPRRARVLAAGGGAQQGHGGASSTGSGWPSTSRWRRTWSNPPPG